MKTWMFKLLVVTGTVMLTVGCKSLFPSSSSVTASRWQSYNEIEEAFGKIVPNQTGSEELKALGVHPTVSPNVKILTYVDIIQFFMPNPGIRKEDLPEAVRACIDVREQSSAYLLELHDINDKRHGNLFLDVFGFKRLTHQAGWEFKGLILLKDDKVVYKLSSGEPQISRDEKKVKPLGPLQELDQIFSASRAAGMVR